MQTLAAIGAFVFLVGIIWLAVSLLRMLSKNSRESAKRNFKYSIFFILGSFALPIVGAIVQTPGRTSVATSQQPPVEQEIGDTQIAEQQVQSTSSPEPTAEQIAAAREAELRATSKWQVARGTSSIDDSRIVQITLASDNNLPARFGGRGPATLSLRCQENTTTATIRFNGHFMASIQSYGRVTYRVDSRQAKTINMQESTNNEWLGLWRGNQSIPFIRDLLGADQLVVRATPFNESPMEAEFSISGLDLFIGELRAACNW